jgi:hypothetical protein
VRLNINCCCDPNKCLGSLEVPDSTGRGTLYVPTPEGQKSVQIETLFIRHRNGTREVKLAIKSMDMGIEYFENIPGYEKPTKPDTHFKVYTVKSISDLNRVLEDILDEKVYGEVEAVADGQKAKHPGG